jgi:hypothetical protein
MELQVELELLSQNQAFKFQVRTDFAEPRPESESAWQPHKTSRLDPVTRARWRVVARPVTGRHSGIKWSTVGPASGNEIRFLSQASLAWPGPGQAAEQASSAGAGESPGGRTAWVFRSSSHSAPEWLTQSRQLEEQALAGRLTQISGVA